MTDERTGRELTPRDESGAVTEESGALTPAAQPEELGVERFSAGPRAHSVTLTEERSAQVVRQSGNARNIAFLAFLILAIFIPIYWFYDLGIPALGAQGRLAAEAQVQYVTDVSRGYATYLANCARCHGTSGQGGIGPPLNDQAKLYNVLTDNGGPGKGHLNPAYLLNVLTVGGRYVCGDPNSLMPVWAQPRGPLNYIQVNQLIAWLTASKATSFIYQPPKSEIAGAAAPEPTAEVVVGWRDPQWTPAPGAPSPPACWRNPSGQIGGQAPSSGAPASAAPIGSPGTADAPRVIQLDETAALTITDTGGVVLSSLPVAAGEVLQFQVNNQAGFDHNFYIGPPDKLSNNDTTGLTGTPAFESGTQTITYTVPASGELQFACTLPGHYATMHASLDIQP